MKKTFAVFIVFMALLRFGIASEMTLRLSGDLIPSTFIQEQIENVFENLYGTKTKVHPLPRFSLPSYQKKTLTVAFSNAESGSRLQKLTITSERIPPSEDPLLLFSNHPETLHEDGLLFSAGVIFLRPVRLNYYHANGAGEPPRALVIRVDNKNDEPALIHILEARSGPSKDEMSTGHKASLLFLTRHAHNLGRIEVIPPNDYLVITNQVANAGELLTGFIEVKELKGHPLQIAVFAQDPETAMQKHDSLLESKDTHARGAYEMSKLLFNACYQVGDDPKVISLGDLPLRNLLPGQPLKGAYGMLWEGKVTLKNPFPTIEKVPVYFQPRGGAATGTFVLTVGSKTVYKEFPPIRSYQSPLLSEFVLPPLSEKTFDLLTMPEGGSSYPIYLILGRNNRL